MLQRAWSLGAVALAVTETRRYWAVAGKPALTARDMAQRATSTGTQQHVAIVVDEKVVSRPFVDPRQYPNGIDGGNGIQITGGYTVEEARNLADRINSAG